MPPQHLHAEWRAADDLPFSPAGRPISPGFLHLYAAPVIGADWAAAWIISRLWPTLDRGLPTAFSIPLCPGRSSPGLFLAA
jgi:hypothetical protein